VCWLKYSAVVGLTVFHREHGLLEALRACGNECLTDSLGVILG
jgi:hypothetical protein